MVFADLREMILSVIDFMYCRLIQLERKSLRVMTLWPPGKRTSNFPASCCLSKVGDLALHSFFGKIWNCAFFLVDTILRNSP